jgi:hypothetical protein
MPVANYHLDDQIKEDLETKRITRMAAREMCIKFGYGNMKEEDLLMTGSTGMYF